MFISNGQFLDLSLKPFLSIKDVHVNTLTLFHTLCSVSSPVCIYFLSLSFFSTRLCTYLTYLLLVTIFQCFLLSFAYCSPGFVFEYLPIGLLSLSLSLSLVHVPGSQNGLKARKHGNKIGMDFSNFKFPCRFLKEFIISDIFYIVKTNQ